MLFNSSSLEQHILEHYIYKLEYFFFIIFNKGLCVPSRCVAEGLMADYNTPSRWREKDSDRLILQVVKTTYISRI